jgi:predicted nucleic acid-binding protein
MTSMNGRTFLDSNILVYLFDNDSKAKQGRARELLELEGAGENTVISTQVLQEFYVTVTRKLAKPLEPKPALAAVMALASLPVVQIYTDTVLSAIRRSQSDQLSFWDALIVQAALEGGCKRLFTEDLQHGRMIDELQIENPFL